MSENDQTATPPWPDHVVPGSAPDPVVETAPVAPPAPETTHGDDVDELLTEERPVIMPPAGPQAGVVIPPVER